MNRSEAVLSTVRTSKRCKVGRRSERHPIGLGGVFALAGLLCLLAIPVTAAAAVQNSVGLSQAVSRDISVTSASATA
jgi:hypothetical protein